MMQLADLGEVATVDETNGHTTMSEKVYNHLADTYLFDHDEFGPECLTEHEKVCKYIFARAAVGLKYLHEEAFVVNRDIKPENIVFATQDGGTNIMLEDRP